MMTTYKEAGVDIQVANEAIKRIKPLAEKTFSPEVCTEIGAFGALYDLKKIINNYEHPLLVQSIDGVGTKTVIAKLMQKFDTLGIDLVSATANDIVVMGATPLTLLDYIAADKLHPDIIEAIMQGMSQACCEENIALIGGETAEMPGVYKANEYDLAGVITGVVEKKRVITGANIVPGDLVFGVQSSGLHTNGYSLARKLLLEVAGLNVESYHPELGTTIGEALLAPHLNYTKPILKALNQGVDIKGMAHITGGGFLDNIPRILPAHSEVAIQKNSWPAPPLFTILQQIGKLDIQSMFHTFNMGIGLVIILSEAMSDQLQAVFKQFPAFSLYQIGYVQEGPYKQVRIS